MDILLSSSLSLQKSNISVQAALLKESNEFSGKLAKELLSSLPTSNKVNYNAPPGQQVRIIAR